MKSDQEERIRAIWEFEYTPRDSRYPRKVRDPAERAQVDMAAGLFKELMEEGKGVFRFEVVRS